MMAPDKIFHLGDGSWLGLVPPRDIHLWKDGKYVTFRNFPQDIEWTIIDASGSLVLQLDGGETWLLSPEGKEWRKISEPEPQASPPAPPARSVSETTGTKGAW